MTDQYLDGSRQENGNEINFCKNQNIKYDPYADIRYLSHHESKTHPRMPRANRAAQFMPFSALSGYEEAVQETARQTEQFRELDEDSRRRLDETLQVIQQNLGKHLEVPVIITCFVPDKFKDGGSYQEYSGLVKRVDAYRRRILLLEGTALPIDHITDIQMRERKRFADEFSIRTNRRKSDGTDFNKL